MHGKDSSVPAGAKSHILDLGCGTRDAAQLWTRPQNIGLNNVIINVILSVIINKWRYAIGESI